MLQFKSQTESCYTPQTSFRCPLCKNLQGYHADTGILSFTDRTRALDLVSVRLCGLNIIHCSLRLMTRLKKSSVSVSLSGFPVPLFSLNALFQSLLSVSLLSIHFFIKLPSVPVSPGLILWRLFEVSSPHSDHERRCVVSACRSLQAWHHSQGGKHTFIVSLLPRQTHAQNLVLYEHTHTLLSSCRVTRWPWCSWRESTPHLKNLTWE